MTTPSFFDPQGHNDRFSFPPRRIVSLVPSQTELLYDLGLQEEVIGITKFCIHPQHWKHQKKIVGGTKNFRFDLIDELKPDLILGNKEENYQEGIEELREKYPVWISDIVTLNDAFHMIGQVGSLTGKKTKAEQVIAQIRIAFADIKKKAKKKALYLIWRNPWMAAASQTFIHSMLEEVGLENCLAHQLRYPEVTEAEMKALDPEVILLSSEPYPFREKHRAELQKKIPSAKIVLVDGEIFSWYGSRLIHAPRYLNELQL